MPAIERLEAASYRIPTERPEADGTLAWDHTTVLVVHAFAGGRRGLGFSYTSAGAVDVVHGELREAVVGRDATAVPACWLAMVRAVRNLGRPGVVSSAIAAVDVALWDLRSVLDDLPLATVLGAVRDEVPVYGSGGFTSYSDDELVEQLGGWAHDARIPRVKMKIGVDRGARPAEDLRRVALARSTIGPGCELFVDANGAYGTKQAVRVAERLSELGVGWFEEPVSSDDLDGLRAIRTAVDVEVAAGEYGCDLAYFARMCEHGAVDVLQADVSRCAGITEWLRVAALAAGHGLEVSGHCAQSLHAHAACAVVNLRHLEYFHDHARIDRMLFDGVLDPTGGVLRPDLARPGTGLVLREQDAARFRVR